ncbi:PREDICTED: alpha-(1,3)-fucosyltransferase 7-like [Branchiostoma belcheri]|uniref:Fucosyltransferase n=1 Tax=Branchiostoma belcheri TaxID=7741 RepID=A0A6P4YHP9_BRABE|nr:PREDICTED: alpha-(1,3)-fucosyltransferase 7-like [Branchiostoma belcheri]XP_019621454.1 PREDICTED: alpha-(1,3)-fucosyltransferase 7-like [Branchiostoma belcheri]
METRRKAVNATPAPNTNFLKKTGTLVVLLLILTVLCAYIAYTGFDVSSVVKHSVSPHRPAYGKKSKDKRHRHEKAPVIERSLLPRYSHLISADDNPLSQYYTVWNEETPQSVLKARGDRRKILVWEQWRTLAVLPRQACPSMPQCEFTLDRGQIAEADGVVFWFRLLPLVYDRSYFPTVRPAHQHWIMRSGDCPYLTRAIDWVSYAGVFNWTMTYRNDSDVYIPYGTVKTVFDDMARRPDTVGRLYPKQKGKLIIWYVSNCYKHLSRFAYANELMKYIKVDVFGACGREYCGYKAKDQNCFSNHLRQYKFYLAFENFQCIYYITEKFWKNAFQHGLVPVVLGAPKGDYVRVAPSNSFIHIDDFKNPRALASYLMYLDKNEDKYMEYFAWRNNPPKNLPDYESHWCETCKMLVQAKPMERKVYNDIDKWWRGPNYEFCEPMIVYNSISNMKNESFSMHYT